MRQPASSADKIKKVIYHLLYENKTVRRVVQRIRRRVIRFSPFLFWIQEGVDSQSPPVLKDNAEHYSYEFVGMDEMDALMDFVPNYSVGYLMERFKAGKKCYTIKYKGKIVAFQWYNLNECAFKGNNFCLNNDEAYLFDMRVASTFRGKNLAPCLAHEGLLALKKMGRDTFYSETEYFNLPAIRYKEKMNAKLLWVGIYIELFNRINWRWIVKRYH